MQPILVWMPDTVELSRAERVAEQRKSLPDSPGVYLFKDEHGHWSGLNKDVLDRISAMTLLEDRYPQRRRVLLKQWREKEGITTARN